MKDLSPRKCLSENRLEALRDLHISPTHKLKRDESSMFLVYLNYAVYNICKCTNISEAVSSKGVEKALKLAGREAIHKLANFFWLFAVDDPETNYPDYQEKTIAIAKKIYELRDYFAHLNRNGVKPLTMDVELYRFIGGVLYSESLNQSILPGLRTEKLFKIKLFAARNDEKTIYEFTRRGLIFLICLSLYRDEAYEFTQCLEDMKLPTCPRGNDITDTCNCTCSDIATCKPGVAKAFITMFTYFSARRGRSVNFLTDDFNYMSFADISGYLNKAPADSVTYLTLEKENSMLREKYEKSTESEENKKFKYVLHKRCRERFLSFAAGYLEDFDLLPVLKFKRLDISNNEGRKRYFFGKEHDNRQHMDRHYEIIQNAIRFEWVPQKHYGDIHIDSLRSAMSSRAMKELLYTLFQKEPARNAINDYFTAYHRVLETIINTPDPDDIRLEGSLLEDMAFVAGCDVNQINIANLKPLKTYFSDNLLRFFSQEDSMPDDKILSERLEKRLIYLKQCAESFCIRLKKFNEWKEELGRIRKNDPDAKLPKPKCTSAEVKIPPFICDISDASLIHWVFQYFNLFLSDDKKFRQLPRGEQHRGVIDFEYQTVHALIGKFSLDSKGLENHIKKNKPELLAVWNELSANIKKLQKEEAQKRPIKLNKWGKPVLPLPTLNMLAQVAAEGYLQYCNNKLNGLKKVDSKKLRQLCKKFGVRTGMPLDRSSLIKTILHIDLATWMQAYDHENKEKYENRTLSDTGHIVSQIPFPNDFAQRIMLNSKKPFAAQWIRQTVNNIQSFDFNAAFTALETEIAPREFYDITPLIAANYAVKQNVPLTEIPGLRTFCEDSNEPVEFTHNTIKKAIANIKESCNQDKLLLKIAYAYWTSFQSQGKFTADPKKKKLLTDFSGTPSIYEYFSAATVYIKFPDDERRIRIMPNDVNKPILSQIQANASEIASVMDPDNSQQEFEFYEMLKEYRVIQARDRTVRFDLVPWISVFDYSVTEPENLNCSSDERHTILFNLYKQRFPALSRQEFDAILKLRNAIYHCGFNLQVGNVKEILKKYVSLPTPPPPPPQKPKYKMFQQKGFYKNKEKYKYNNKKF